MKRKFRIIPFWMTRKARELTDKEKQIEKFRYYFYEDYDLDKKILDIEYEDKTILEYRKKSVELEYKYNMIDYNSFEKELYNIEEKPYIVAKKFDWEKDSTGKKNLSIELDWNDYFISELVSIGYSGDTQDEIVDKWFVDTCSQISDINYLFG